MAELKSEHQRKIAKKLDEVIGRPPADTKEKRLRAATTDILAGDKPTEVERLYALNNVEIQRFIKKTFPNDVDRYQFLEDCMLQNSMMAQARFAQVFGEMSAIDAARAATMFAGKAIEIRKARENGFKEAPLNVAVILSIEKTLQKLSINEK